MDELHAARHHDEFAGPERGTRGIMALLEQVTEHLLEHERHADRLHDFDRAATATGSSGRDVAGSIARIRDELDHLVHRMAHETAAVSAADPNDPWDQASADALAGIYHGEPVRPAVRSVPAAVPPAAQRVQPGPATLYALDPAGLDQRLDRLATRIDDGFRMVAQADSALELGRRLDAIEQQLQTPADTGGTDKLLAGLESLEQDLAALTRAVDQVGAKAERVGNVERSMQELAGQIDTKLAQPGRRPLDEGDIDRMARAVSGLVGVRLEKPVVASLTDEAIGRIADRSAADVVRALPKIEPVRQSDDDLKRIAESIGRVLVGRVTTALQSMPRAEAGDIEGLKKQLESMFQDQRRSEAQVSEMLDTMQHALLGLLDRMDSLERPAAEAAPAPAPVPAPMPTPGAAPSITAVFPEMQSPPGSKVAEARIETPAPAPRPAPAVTEPSPAFTALTAQTANAERSKEDFVASARRAAAQAHQAQQQQQPQPTPAPAPRKKSGKPAAAKTAGRPLLSRPVLIGLLTIVCAVSAYLAFVRKPAQPPADPAAIERPAKPQNSSAIDGEKEVEFADVAEDVDTDPTTLAAEPGVRLAGAVVQTDGQISPLALLREQEQQGIARLSSQMGAFVQRTSAVEAPAASSETTAVEMPPAMVGPTSLRLAAQSGDPSAQFAVAARLGEGRGVAQSLDEAARWYQRSAQGGFALAQYRLGTYYERGFGVPKDPARAAAWYARAAEQGNVKAMHNVAVLNTGREGAAADYDVAVKWFTKAASHGLRDSMFNLGILYESGLGVEQDYANAYKYLALAARAGDAQAVKRLASVRARLLPARAGAVDDAVAAWQPIPSERIANDPLVAGEQWKTRARLAPAAGANEQTPG